MGDDYRRYADGLAADIATGKLRPGERLPPQRVYAHRRGIAASTAARVYRELIRRGLAVGEVGRGTYVRSTPPGPEPALTEPGAARVDLERSFPVLPDQPAMLAGALAAAVRPEALARSLHPVGVHGTAEARAAAVDVLATASWRPVGDRVMFAGNGRQAVAAAIAALVPVGERLGVEAMTYPVVKAVADRLGVTLVPLATDGEGLRPDAVRDAHREKPLRAVYVQPVLQNPLGTTMSEARRTGLARALAATGIPAIEDRVYAFLDEGAAPLAAVAPDRTVVVDSLTKRLAPGLTLGFVVPPPALLDPVAVALRSGVWTAFHWALDAATRLMADGTVAAVERAKRADAATRQQLARTRLAGLDVRADPHAYHLWWTLPVPWRAETFVAAAARRGIAVTPAAAFAVGTAHAPNAVRLALAAPPMAVLADALQTLAALARRPPDDAGVE